MKFPSRLVLAVLAAGVLCPAFLAWSAGAKAAKAAARGKKVSVSPAITAVDIAEADSLRRADSLARYAPVRVLDSLWHLDSLRRKHPLKGRDSIAGARIDSARRVDSTKVAVADSTRKADSTALYARTWFVAKPRDFSQSGSFSLQVQTRLALELKRSGKVRLASTLDTNSTFDGTWKAARASGASKMLYTALYAGPNSARNAMAWVFDLSDGHKLDSARGESPDTADRFANDLARALVRVLRPSAADSTCHADSLALSRRFWAVAEVRNWSSDSIAPRVVHDSLVAGIRGSGLASWGVLVLPDSCKKRHCTDSIAAATGIDRVVHSILARQADSTWVLSLWVARSKDDSLTDSLRVTGADPSLLAARALRELLPWPSSCPRCAPSGSRTVWSYSVTGDSASRNETTAFAVDLRTAFLARTDRQFLSIPANAAPDSTARVLGVNKLATATISGNDSLRVLRAVVRDLATGASDTLMLRRGGPASRVLPWFARHLAAFGAQVGPACGNTCAADSLRAATTAWCLMPTTGADSTVVGMVNDHLVESFLARKNGKIISLPDNLPCKDLPCLDSIAGARSIRKLVWPQVVRKKDSLWVLSARVSDVATDEWTDSVQVRDTGALEAISRLSSRFWGALAPVPAPCDSCISRDTLESALAIALPAWNGPGDSIKVAFRDSLVRILSEKGRYQTVDLRDVDSIGRNLDSASLARLRCKTGAAYLLRSSAVLEKEGWRVKASITDIGTGKTVAAVETQEKTNWPGRPAEISPWVARRLLGTDTTATAPKSNHSTDVPWGRILLLVVPLAIGVGSVVYHW